MWALSHLFVTDVSPSHPYNHSPVQLYPLSPSQHRTFLQIPWSNLVVKLMQNKCYLSDLKGVKATNATTLTHLSVTGASLFLLCSRTPKQPYPLFPSPPRTFLRIPWHSLVEIRCKYNIKQMSSKQLKTDEATAQTHLFVTGASLSVLYSRTPKPPYPLFPSPPRTFLRIPLSNLKTFVLERKFRMRTLS